MGGITINEDCSHFFMDRNPEDWTVAGLETLVSHYAVGDVAEIFFNPNCMKTSYGSTAFEPIWHHTKENKDGDICFERQLLTDSAIDKISSVNWIRSARALHEKNIDPYCEWVRITRQYGRSPWISCRMNDLHGADNPRFWLHCDFWRNHPELYRAPHRPNEDWMGRAFDYARPEVRNFYQRLLEEFLERYDMDGLELDWMRFGWHLAPGREAEGRAILTDFIRRIRVQADLWQKRRGHPIRLAVRVPAHVEDAWRLGFDVVGWVREKLVDWVTPTAFFCSSDTDMPIALWRQLLGNEVTLAAGLELLIRPSPVSDAFRSRCDIVLGEACNYLSQGADRIYLFNFMDSRTGMDSPEEFRQVLEQAGTLEKAAAGARRHVITYCDTRPLGMRCGNALPEILRARPYDTSHFHISIGPGPEPGRRCEVIFGFAEAEEPEFGKLRVFLNGHLLEPRPLNTEQLRGTEFPIPASSSVLAAWDAAPAAKSGDNVMEVINLGKADRTVSWAEIRIAARE